MKKIDKEILKDLESLYREELESEIKTAIRRTWSAIEFDARQLGKLDHYDIFELIFDADRITYYNSDLSQDARDLIDSLKMKQLIKLTRDSIN